MHEAAKTVREEKLLRLLLTGYMMRECAKMLQVSYATVRKYASDEEFLRKLKEMSMSIYEEVDSELKLNASQVTQRIDELSDKALDTLETLLASDKDIVKLKAADSILDRNPESSKQKKVEQTTNTRFLDPLHLIHAAKTATEVDEYENRKLTGGTDVQPGQ